jgi:hypothetical protein
MESKSHQKQKREWLKILLQDLWEQTELLKPHYKPDGTAMLNIYHYKAEKFLPVLHQRQKAIILILK